MPPFAGGKQRFDCDLCQLESAPKVSLFCDVDGAPPNASSTASQLDFCRAGNSLQAYRSPPWQRKKQVLRPSSSIQIPETAEGSKQNSAEVSHKTCPDGTAEKLISQEDMDQSLRISAPEIMSARPPGLAYTGTVCKLQNLQHVMHV